MSRDDEWFHGALSRDDAQKILYEGLLKFCDVIIWMINNLNFNRISTYRLERDFSSPRKPNIT